MNLVADFDLFLRGAGVGVILLEIVLLLRGYGDTLAGRLGAVFAVSIAAYLLCPLFGARWHAGAWGLPLYLLCFTVSGWFWLFSRAWFEDGFRLRLHHGLLILALCAVYGWRYLLPGLAFEDFQKSHELDAPLLLHVGSRLFSLGFVIAALAQAQLGRRDDLVEMRRLFRAGFVLIVGAHIVVVAIAEIALGTTRPSPVADVINLAAINIELALFLALSLTVRDGLFARPAPARPASAASPDEDRALVAAIDRLMAEEQGFTRAGLTIGGLAAALNVPEYRLRRVINRQLGHHNFPQFLNSYRIAQAKEWLADPGRARLPVLTIAMDLGYNSIGPFNRAFKADTGMTPVEFRANSRADS